MTSLSFFPAFAPPKSGGELRYWHLSVRLAERFPTLMLTPTHPHVEPETVEHTPNCVEKRFPKSQRHIRLHHRYDRFGGRGECSAHVVSLCAAGETAYRAAVAATIEKTPYVFHALPYFIHLTPKKPGRRIIYDAHNVEFDLQQQVLGGALGRLFVERLRRLERRACRNADLVFATCEADRDRLLDLYPCNPAKFHVAPNGVDTRGLRPPTPAQRAEARAALGLGAQPAVLFFGSAFGPNVDALEFIVRNLAPACPSLQFLIAGSAGEGWQGAAPPNCRILGRVDDPTRLALLRAADIAINPVELGSGVNLKMLEYMALGLPIVATRVGARGLDIVPGREALIVSRGEFAEASSALVEHPETAAGIGRKARALADARYDWDPIAKRMIEAIEALDKPSLVVANSFPLYPPRFGGQVRGYNIYRHLAERIPVVHVCPSDGIPRPVAREIAPNLLETLVPKSRWQRAVESVGRRLFGIGVDDVACLFTSRRSPAGRILGDQAFRSTIRVASEPYLAHLFPPAQNGQKTLVYEALNVEASLKAQVLKGSCGKWLARRVSRAERDVLHRAGLVFAMSDEERRDLAERYKASAPIVLSPNGTDTEAVALPAPGEREALKRLIGLDPRTPVLIFIGSGHPPNAEAARAICQEIAPEIPEAIFFLVGAVCYAIDPRAVPRNAKMFYHVSDAIRLELLKTADLAVNPMRGGAGTSLKMFDFLAAGLPVVSTPEGARGIPGIEESGIALCQPAEMPARVREILRDPPLLTDLSFKARRFACERYDWRVIAERMWETLEKVDS